MKRISLLLLVFFTGLVVAAWPQSQAWKHNPKIVTSDAKAAGQGAGQGGYSFQTIDAPFGQPGVDMDMQCLYRSIVVVLYQIPRSGACCGGPGFSENDHTAVLRGRTWTNIDVPGAVSTLTSNPDEQGQVALNYKFADGVWHVAIHNHRGLAPFPDPHGYPGGIQVNGINNRGVVAGFVLDAGGHSHGFFGDGVHNTILDYPGAMDTYFTKVADTGVAVGYYGLPDESLHAFQYKAGHFSAIDPPGAAGVAVALSINNAGEISGAYFDVGGSLVGFLFEKGRFIDFRVPDAGLTIPWSINNRGQISGIYAGSDGVYHGYVATPIP
jgi:hypothetical protein